MTDASSAQLPVTANFVNPETMHHPAGYTHVVEVTAGRPVYIAGQVALDPAGALVGPGDIRAQARQVFDNLRAALQAVGAGFEQVVKLTHYLVDASQLPIVREIRDQYINTRQPPRAGSAGARMGTMPAWPAIRNPSASGTSPPSPSRRNVATRPAGYA